MAFTIIFAFIGVTIVIVERADKDFEQLVIGALIALVTGATGFYFGSSSSSQKKDDVTAAQNQTAIAALATSAPVPAPSDAAAALATKLGSA